MKNKIFTRKIVLAISFLSLIFFCASYATASTCDPAAGYFCNPLVTSGGGGGTMMDFIVLAIQTLLTFVGIFSLLFIIVGGIKYIVAAGSEEAMESAKHTITSALTGLVLALLAYSIVTGLEEIFKVKS